MTITKQLFKNNVLQELITGLVGFKTSDRNDEGHYFLLYQF